MKTYLIVIFAVFILILSTVYFTLIRDTGNRRETVATTSGVLLLKNFKDSGIRIITDADATEISIDIEGSEGLLDDIWFNQIDKGATEFSLPDELKGLKGIIIVPANVRII